MKRNTFVYLIRPVGQKGPIKIGVSTRPESRLAQMQAGSPVPLEIVTTIPGGHQAEAYLHYRFRDLRLHGEWFDVDDDFLDWVEQEADLEDFSTMEKWYEPPPPTWLERHFVLSIGPWSYEQFGVFG